MKKTTLKFAVTRNREVPNAKGEMEAQVTLYPVNQTSEDSENKKAFKGLPNGTVELNNLNPEAFKGWPIGTELTITFEGEEKTEN